VYGAEHLLRLVVKLPELLPQTGVTGEALQLLIRRLEDLLTYLQVSCLNSLARQAGFCSHRQMESERECLLRFCLVGCSWGGLFVGSRDAM
jgi:hypothetical protein